MLRLELAAVGNLDRLHRAILRAGPGALNLLHNIKALDDLAEHDVAPVPANQGVAEWTRRKGEQWAGATMQGRPQGSSCRRRCETHSQGVATVVMKNWEPLVPGPALAMLIWPGLVCLYLHRGEHGAQQGMVRVRHCGMQALSGAR